MTDSFKARTTLEVGAEQYEILSLNALKSLNVDRLPFSLKILLENLLRFEDGVNVTKSDIEMGAEQYEILSLNALKSLNVDRLPFSLKILLENLLRFEDGVNVTKSDI